MTYFSRRAKATIGNSLVCLALCAAVFVLHKRWVYTHFSSDGYLLDSGWLAYLFGSGNPSLRNPSGVNNLSFYAHHLSPHIFLFGAPLVHLFGLSGVQVLAYHQGLFFALFFVSLYLIVASARLSLGRGLIASLVAICVGTLSNILFQAAAYPHFEIAMLAISSLALAAGATRHNRPFLVCLLWLPLIREDGGLYSAFTCLACILIESGTHVRLDYRTRRLLALAAIGVFISACSFALKPMLFPGFDAFASNFSGHSWDHLSDPFLADRVRAMLLNVNILPVLVGTILLAAFDLRYLTGLLLLSPLYLLHLLSVRTEHGHFTLYFALPWLLPCVVWLAVFVRRAELAIASAAESILMLILSLATSAPAQAAAGIRGQSWYVAKWALSRPVVDIRAMTDYSLWVRRSYSSEYSKNCVSMGIAALIPNDVMPSEVLQGTDDVASCHTLLLMRGDMQYGPLSGQAGTDGFKQVASKDTTELWMRSVAPRR